MPVAALGVHQLRYYLAYGAGWQAELARTGHSYLHSVVPWLVLLLALTLGSFLGRLGRAYSGYRSLGRYATSLVGLWLVCTLALVTIFACQEFLEGLFVTGHPAGLVGIFGYGGWWAAIPVAACFGLMLATLFHGALWVLDAVADVAIRLDETPAHPRHRLTPHGGQLNTWTAGILALRSSSAGWWSQGDLLVDWPHWIDRTWHRISSLAHRARSDCP